MVNQSSGSLLDILQAQGQQFVQSFSLSEQRGRKRKHFEGSDTLTEFSDAKTTDCGDSGYEEWQGFSQGTSEPEDASYSRSGSDSGTEAFELDNNGYTTASSSHVPDVVIFSDTRMKSTSSSLSSKPQSKAFMSSKISKLSQDVSTTNHDVVQDDLDDERTNSQNDAILYRLVHTKLLAGSLNPDLDLSPAHRRKALAGRVLEAAGGAKLGKGEKAVREAEKNKAAKRVRLGMVEKQREREQQRLEEAKNLGNYHPTLKRLFEASSSSGAQSRKRDRGLKMGVGKFSGGLLKLSRDEIARGVGSGEHLRGRGRGRGGGLGHRGRGHWRASIE